MFGYLGDRKMMTPKTPECCGKFMKLRTAYYTNGHTWYAYQCIQCGSVEEACEEEDDEDEE